MFLEACQWSAAELTRRYAQGTVSPVEVVRAVLERLDQVNPILNAVIHVDREGSIAAARASETRWRNRNALGPLDGIPLTVKDNLFVRGQPATWGSKLYQNFVPGNDELPVERLRAAGAVLLGKTNCPEFTLQGYTDNLLFGPTRNPWNTALTPGGSSGGAAAAVSAGIGPVAIATDGGGSIRRPASHTGLVGLKPSRGRVPRHGGFPVILLDFETVGPIARAVADIITMMRVIAVPDRRDLLSAPFRDSPFELPETGCRRIAYVPQFGQSPVDPEVAQSVAATAAAWSGLGHRVEESAAPFEADALAGPWAIIGQVGLAWLLQSHPGWEQQVTPAIREMAHNGAAVDGREYYKALMLVRGFQAELVNFFERFDLVLTPSAAALPWPAETAFPAEIAGQTVGPRGHAVFTGFANLAGCPAVNLPADPSGTGLPIGFQLVAAPGNDGLLCALAAQYEAEVTGCNQPQISGTALR
ncbi:MAG TPA: amidase [Chthoniobacterales bacterium]